MSDLGGDEEAMMAEHASGYQKAKREAAARIKALEIENAELRAICHLDEAWMTREAQADTIATLTAERDAARAVMRDAIDTLTAERDEARDTAKKLAADLVTQHETSMWHEARAARLEEALRGARVYVVDAIEAHEHSDGRDLLARIDTALAQETQP